MAREFQEIVVNKRLIVDEGDIVVVSNTQKKKDGVLSKVSILPLVQGNALVGLHPVVDDKSKHKSLYGKMLPNLSSDSSVLLIGETHEFKEGKDFSVSVPNKLDNLRHWIGKKLLGW